MSAGEEDRGVSASLGAGGLISDGVSAAGERLGETVDHAKTWLYGAAGPDTAHGDIDDDAHHDADHDADLDHGESGHARLDLNESDRLPWLESGVDEDYVGIDGKMVATAVIGGLAVLGAVVGGIWFFTHRHDNAAPVADGSVIAAPSEPVREAPKDPGGKQFAGTGDASFAASQGKNRPVNLAGGDAAKEGVASGQQQAANAVQVAASTAAAAGAGFAAGAATGGAAAKDGTGAVAAPARAAVADASGPVGGLVQIAAYSSQASAEAGWSRLVSAHEMLKSQKHRIVSATIEMGTVYRLQLLTAAGGGNALCERIKAEGLACQVKH